MKETLIFTPSFINYYFHRSIEFDRRVKKMKKKCRKGAEEVKVIKNALSCLGSSVHKE